MKIKEVVLVKYGEIALRKGNRNLFESKLIGLIRDGLDKGYGPGAYLVIRERGRFVIEKASGDAEASVISKVKHIFGITAFCPATKMDTREINEIQKIALDHSRSYFTDLTLNTFKVETKRGDKTYRLTSQEISALVGGYILENVPRLKVDLTHPDFVIYIEVRNHVYIYSRSVQGEGGLPYGSSGKGVLLLSGGIDSPVAGYLTAKRGVEIIPVYFHSPPYTSGHAAEKAADIARKLSAYTGGVKLYTVPFTETQVYLYERVQKTKLTIFIKRAMLRIASIIAGNENAHCLITGDSIGQVASQTVHSIESVETASNYPVFRPLCAFDKQQIVDIALSIDTYDISIRPYEDCCTLFVAEHPENKPKASVILGIERRLSELQGLCEQAAEAAEIIEI